MSSIELTPARVAQLKSALRKDYSEVKSSHITEAIASALQFRTHAALQAKMQQYEENDAPFVLLDESLFMRRLIDLEYLDEPEPDFFFSDYTDHGVVETLPYSGLDIEYSSKRTQAWRNLMVLGVNAALEQGLFTLRPDDNRWPGYTPDPREHSKGYVYDFTLPNGLPGRGYVVDAGFSELSIRCAVNPKQDWVVAANAGFRAGDAFASGWLERKRGAYLQSSTSEFNCRKALLDDIAGLSVTPKGFGDRADVIM